MKVREVMTRNALVLKPEITLGDAARIFIKNKIDGAPVIDENNKIINIVTKTDLMKAFVNKIDINTTISEIPSKKVETINENSNIENSWDVTMGRLPVVNDDGNIVGMLTRTDISKKFIVEILKEVDILKNIKLNVKELDAVIESSYDGIYITDGEGNTLKINKSYERITGLKREKMIGKNMRDLIKRKYISQSATLIALKTKKTTTIQQKFNTGRKVMVTSTPIYNEKGKISLVVTNVRDVTQLSELEEELHKNKELTEKYYSEIEEMRMQLINVSDMVVEDQRMLEMMKIARRVSKVDTTILILGETGVGKEEVAKFIHKNSLRSSKQFIKVNCGAIPQNLIESELFGYEKGAFTGANKEGKMGLFELASEGTIFLDEIGELPFDMQVKLLRVLQEQEIERVGGTKPVKIDVRVIAATNRDIEEMVKNKEFREDLYYRLNVVPLIIPPLRKRKGDIFPLMKNFLSQINDKYGFNKSFDADALRCMYEYCWPGNVRELKNIVERVMIISNNDKITIEDLPKKIISPKKYVEGNSIVDEDKTLKEVVESIEKQMINKAYEKYGNVRAAAKSLGIDSSTFVRKRQKYFQNNLMQK